jgi:hypothetical protein
LIFYCLLKKKMNPVVAPYTPLQPSRSPPMPIQQVPPGGEAEDYGGSDSEADAYSDADD